MLKIKEYYEKLTAGVNQILESKEFAEFFSFLGKFRGYSFTNTLLIYIQCRTATKVAGIKTWNSLGRKVKKGSKGIAIYAPMFKKLDDLNVGSNEDISELSELTATRKLVGFRIVYVYDVSQTEGDPLPSMPDAPDTVVSSGSCPETLYNRLLSVAPVPVIMKDTEYMGNKLGYYAPMEDKIYLLSDADKVTQVTTLLHEVAHCIAYKHNEHTISKRERPKAEVIAEAVAYVVAKHYDIDCSGHAIRYIAAWSQDIRQVMQWGEAVQRTAEKIIVLIQGRSLKEAA